MSDLEIRPELAPVRAGEELDWDRLAQYLTSHIEGLQGEMDVLQFPNGSANLTYSVRFGERRLVVRRPPLGQIAPGAHDMKREYRTLSRLWQAYPPAPRAFAFCDDHSVIGSDFLVIDYRPGVVVWGIVPPSMAAHPDVGRRLGIAVVDALAHLHQVDPDAVGLGDLGRPGGFVRRQVAGWQKRWELAALPDSPAAMRNIGSRLAATVPKSRYVSILHNDFKLDNCQFDPADPDRVKSVFDWDQATLGDPLVDVGITLNYWPDPNDVPGLEPILNPGTESLGLPSSRRGHRSVRIPAPATKSTTSVGTRHSPHGRQPLSFSSSTPAGSAASQRTRGWRSEAPRSRDSCAGPRRSSKAWRRELDWRVAGRAMGTDHRRKQGHWLRHRRAAR